MVSILQEKHLSRMFGRYGAPAQILLDAPRGRALVCFNDYELALRVITDMRGRTINGKRIMVSAGRGRFQGRAVAHSAVLQIDFASKESQNDFYEGLEQSQGGGSTRYGGHYSSSRGRTTEYADGER